MAFFGLRRVFVSKQPEIPPEQLIPLPQGTVLCRQPCYRQEKSPDKPINSDKSGPQIEAHQERDRLVSILRQREAHIKALARQAKVELIPKPKVVPPKPKANHTPLSKAKTPMPVVQPDPSIARPPWAWSQPLTASASTETTTSTETTKGGKTSSSKKRSDLCKLSPKHV